MRCLLDLNGNANDGKKFFFSEVTRKNPVGILAA